MQIQHVDVFLSTFAEPLEGDLAVSTQDVTEVLVKVVGTSGIWDAWAVPCGDLAALSGFKSFCVEPVVDDSSHIRLLAAGAVADKRVGLRVYVLSQ